MFPLSSVLFPNGVLPLHIFEPRYLHMIEVVRSSGSGFGVVLIERGSEVGGGEVAFEVGTIARILRIDRVDGDRLAVLAVGVSRIRIVEWLEPEPYPKALVTPETGSPANESHWPTIEAVTSEWRRIVALASELGADVGSGEIRLPEEPEDALWTMCAVSPLGQLDRQRILEAPDADERGSLLLSGLRSKTAELMARLAAG